MTVLNYSKEQYKGKINNKKLEKISKSKEKDLDKKTFIGYYNIDNVDASSKITDFYYLPSSTESKLVDAGKINTPSVPNISMRQTKSNNSLMTGFIEADNNDCELVMIYTGKEVPTPVMFIGKLNSIMKDCYVDIVKGEINPFFGYVSTKEPIDTNYYKVYIRPDLDLLKLVKKNKECTRKKIEQYKLLVQNNIDIKRYNANQYMASKSNKKNLINSMYQMGKIETFSSVDGIERFDSKNPDYSLSVEQQKKNIDAYMGQKEENSNKQKEKLHSKYQEQLNKLQQTNSGKEDHINTLKNLESNKHNIVKTNYNSIQDINQKLYKLNSNIENTSTKYEYNKNMVRLLRIFLLCLFIFMACMIAYYGTKKAYGAKITSKLHEAGDKLQETTESFHETANKMKSRFSHMPGMGHTK